MSEEQKTVDGNETEESNKKTDGFGVLHRNEFFTSTPFSGWAFVEAAKYLKEILFWYLVIFAFLAITAYNVNDLIQYQASKPTKTKVLLRSSGKHLHLPNVTLELKLPVELMLNRMAVDVKLRKNSFDDICNYFIYNMVWKKLTPKEEQGIKSLEAEAKPLEKSKMVGKNVPVLDAATFKDWMNKIDKTRNSLLNFWDKMLDAPPITLQDKETLIAEFSELTEGLVAEQQNDTLNRLFFLQAFKDNSIKGVKESLDGMQMSASEFFSDAMLSLNKFLHVDVDPESPTALLEWRLVWIDSLPQIVTDLLVMPKDRNKIKLKFYLLSDMLMKVILSTFEESLRNHDKMTGICEAVIPTIFVNTLVEHIYLGGVLNVKVGYDYLVMLSGLGGKEVVKVQPVTSFRSATDICNNGSLSGCMETCRVSKYLESCQCLSWNLAYASPTSEICQELCIYDDNIDQLCSVQCSKKSMSPCESVFTSTSLAGFSWMLEADVPELVTVEIIIPETSTYAEFIEEYELTLESFLSLLGGALELWSGVNILGMIHLCAFILWNWLGKFGTTPLESDGNSPSDIASVEAEFDESIHGLENHRKEIKRSKMLLSWLRGNVFYEQTPMSGYAYIAAADTLFEACFWYVAIACFLIFGSVNIYTSYLEFASGPTHTTFVPSASVEDLSLPNVTFVVELPLMELAPFILSTRYDRSKQYSVAELWQLYQDTLPGTHYDMEEAVWDIGRDALKKSFNLMSPQNGESSGLSLSSSAIFDQWQAKFSDGLEAFDDLKKNINQKDLLEIQKTLPHLIEAPLQDHVNPNFVLNLILLEAVKIGTDPRKLIQNLFIWPSPVPGQFAATTASEILDENDWSATKLLQETLSGLQNLFIVSTSNEMAAVYLTDCSVDPSFVRGQELLLSLELRLPEGIQEIELEIHSYMYTWLNYVMHWSNQVVDIDDPMSTNLSLIAYIVQEHLEVIFGDVYFESDLKIMSQFHLFPKFLFSGSESDVKHKPLWKSSSNTKDCNPSSSEWCVKQCILESHHSECQCTPWDKKYLDNDDMAVCTRPCSLVSLQQCTDLCGPCGYELYDIAAPESLDYDMKKRLFKLNLRIPKIEHPKLTREYELSGNAFLNNLGALLDFWVGINVLAIVHLLVYVFKQCYYFFNRKIHPIDKDEQNDFTIKLRTVQNIHADTLSKINKLKEAAVSQKNLEEGSSFSWLRQNKFFEQTDMTGFGFILVARHRTEVLFWYLLITVFLALTVNNVCNAFLLYSSEPTQTTLSLGRNIDQVPFGNFTLIVEVPLTEFSMQNPLYGPIDDSTKSPRTGSAANYLLCSFTSDFLNNYQHTKDQLLLDWMDLLESDFEQSNAVTQTGSMSLDMSHTLDQWLDTFAKESSQLLEFFEENQDLDAVKRQEKQDEFSALVNGPATRFTMEQIERFILLESFKHGAYPAEKLYTFLNQSLEDFGLSKTFKEIPKTNINARDIFNQVQQDVLKIININSSAAIETFFVDWDFTHEMQIMTFKIGVPADVNEITIEVRFFRQAWLSKILQTFREYFKSKGQEHTALCGNQDFDTVFERINDNMVDWMLSNTDTDSNLLVTHQGTFASLFPAEHQQYIMRPSTQFYSQTQGCAAESYQECVARCVADLHVSNCGCLSWNYLYLEIYKKHPVCTDACNVDTGECEVECERKIQHPCHSSIYALTEFKDDFEFTTETAFALTIKKDEQNHAVYTETYYFTTGSFIAHLGGLLEFWMGLNLLSLTHLMVYIIKQLIGFRKNTSTANSVIPETASELLEIQKREQRVTEKVEMVKKEIEVQMLMQKREV